MIEFARLSPALARKESGEGFDACSSPSSLVSSRIEIWFT